MGNQQSIVNMAQGGEGMTLWQMIQAGGWLMIVLFAFSLMTIALIIYNFKILRRRKLAPARCAEELIEYLERTDYREVQKICQAESNIFTRIMDAGMERRKRGKISAKEAMEGTARTEIGILWQNIGYLADIATVAPLVGLLGTVMGMIQAFNAVAFQSAVVKPIILAGGVSKAMVTTATGLIVAIPALIFYAYFKTKVQSITALVENYSQDMIKVFLDVQDAEGFGPSGEEADPANKAVRAEEKNAREERLAKDLRMAKGRKRSDD